MGCHLISWGLAGRGGGVLYRMCTEMPSTAHAQWWLSTPLAREYVCQWCGKALPPLGIEPLPPAPKARALKGRAIWTLVASHRYRGGRCISTYHCPVGSIWPFFTSIGALPDFTIRYILSIMSFCPFILVHISYLENPKEQLFYLRRTSLKRNSISCRTHLTEPSLQWVG